MESFEEFTEFQSLKYLKKICNLQMTFTVTYWHFLIALFSMVYEPFAGYLKPKYISNFSRSLTVPNVPNHLPSPHLSTDWDWHCLTSVIGQEPMSSVSFFLFLWNFWWHFSYAKTFVLEKLWSFELLSVPSSLPKIGDLWVPFFFFFKLYISIRLVQK